MRVTNFVLTVLLLLSLTNQAQEKQERILTEFSPFLSKAYYNFNLGGIFSAFSDRNLQPGYFSETRQPNRFSGRFLLGYKFKEDLALQFGVMRPASWYNYLNVNGEVNEKSVWINLWSLSLKKDFKIADRLAIYAETGIGNLTRVGFSVGEETVYEDAHYATFVSGLGFDYTLGHRWDLLLNGTYLPEYKKHNQPSIFQLSLGLQYNLRQIPREEAEAKLKQGYFFPKRFIQLGYGTGGIGFFTNEFFSMQAQLGNFDSFGLPMFWLGESKAAHTFAVTYQQTAYHGKKLFSLDWGVSITGFQTEEFNTNVYAFSVFPVMRFYVWRRKPFDFYLNYSVIGPTLLTEANIDDLETGPRLTYQDFMGAGMFVGRKRNLNFEIRIMHYSNGNIFTENEGVAIPIVFTIGKTL